MLCWCVWRQWRCSEKNLNVHLLKYFRLLEGSAVDICRPFPYTVLVVVGSLQFQLTTKNEIGTPFRGSLSHFFRRGYFATAPFIAPLRKRELAYLFNINAGFPRLCAVKARKGLLHWLISLCNSPIVFRESCLRKTALPLKSPTGAFIAAQPRHSHFRRKRKIQTLLLSEKSSDFHCLVRWKGLEPPAY